MKEYRFEGYSDDIFGEYGVTNESYDNCASGEPIQFKIETPKGVGVIVTGTYGNPINKGHCWMIGVEAINENKPVSDWTFELKPSHKNYCNLLVVKAPDDAELTCLNEIE